MTAEGPAGAGTAALTLFLLGAGFSAADGAPVMGNYLMRIAEVFGHRPEWRDVRACVDWIFGPGVCPSIEVVLDALERWDGGESAALGAPCAGVKPKLLKLMYGALTPFEKERESFDVEFGTSHADAVGWVGHAPQPEQEVYGLSHVSRVRKHATDCLCNLVIGRKDVVVLSTNWDIILDQRLLAHGAELDYGAAGRLSGTVAGPQVKLFKVHGSVNWAKCGSCDKIRLWHDSYPIQGLMAGATLRASCECGGVCWEPVVVHPIPRNGPSSSLRGVWKQAEDALARTRRLVVIGYSLPETDEDVRTLLVRSLCSEAAVLVIDPADHVWQRFETLFPGRVRAMVRPWASDMCHNEEFLRFAFGGSV